MRVIMMGTGPFAVPTFRRLLESRHEVRALFTRPARPLHGKTAAEANPMRDVAVEHGVRVHDPESINTPHARAVLASYRADLFVVCDYGQILRGETLDMARLGGINLHASLLPKYRGAAPINWAIYHGETETGVTIIHMNAHVDAGPAIAQAKMPIGRDETAAELEPRLAELGAPLVLEAVDALESGSARAIEQDSMQATRAPRLSKELGQVDWSRSAVAIANQVRALKPWPKTFTYWQRPGGQPLRLILEKVGVETAPSGQPGVVLEAKGERLVVGTGERSLAIDALQPSGKRVLSTGEFLRGYAVQADQRFGPAASSP
jgi:methionyl-tRNA formyltransferase